MKNRIATRSEQLKKARNYMLYDVIFLVLACISPKLWLTGLCAFFSALMSIGAFMLLANALFNRDVFIEDERSSQIQLPRHR